MSLKKAILAVIGCVAAQVTFAATDLEVYADSFEGRSFLDMGEKFRWVGGAWNFVAPGVARDGTKAMRFGYPPGWNTSAEERFALTGSYPEIWIRYWLRVPTNFQHMSRPGMASNNKLFALWMDDYSAHGKGASVIWEYWDNGKGGSELAVHYSTGNYTGAGEHRAFTPFIDAATDKGRWMQIAFHVKVSSAPGRADGKIETYRRWENETAFKQIQNIGDAVIAIHPDIAQKGWAAGYFMGWSNPGFDVQTDFYIDNVEFSVEDLSVVSNGKVAWTSTSAAPISPVPVSAPVQGDKLDTPLLKSATVKQN